MLEEHFNILRKGTFKIKIHYHSKFSGSHWAVTYSRLLDQLIYTATAVSRMCFSVATRVATWAAVKSDSGPVGATPVNGAS